MRSLIFLTILAIFSFADILVLQEGEIKAHTEIFGDSEIDLKTNKIASNLVIGQDIESIKGNISIDSLSLVSDSSDRDEHMYEVLNSGINPTINFEIKSIQKTDEKYQINGLLTLNDVKNKVFSLSVISNEENLLRIKGAFSIKLTQFNLEPPSLLFLTVRDQIDIKYNLLYKKGK
jgi:polyisoprenoid-binding protein YceI